MPNAAPDATSRALLLPRCNPTFQCRRQWASGLAAAAIQQGRVQAHQAPHLSPDPFDASLDLLICNELFEPVEDLDRAACPLAFGQHESIGDAEVQAIWSDHGSALLGVLVIEAQR